MSNRSSLIAGDEIDGSPESDEQIADAPNAVPVYWLALFDEADLVLGEAEDDDGTVRAAPSLVTGLAAAKDRLRRRRDLLAARFPEFDPDWERFEARLAEVEARFLRVEIAGLGKRDDGVEPIQSAVRWFESRDEDDFEQLLAAASIAGYDLARRTFAARDDQAPRAFALHGRLSDDTDA